VRSAVRRWDVWALVDLRPKGIPWDQETYKRIERKGGCHYKSTLSDYIELERKIEAHELRYADRVEVYGEGEFNGMRITDCCVVLNGGVYMSTGIKDDSIPSPPTPPPKRVIREGVEITEQDRYDSVSVTGSGRQVEDEDATDINPNRGVWSDPKPITADELNESAVYWLAQAEDARRRARVWAGVAFVSTLVLIVVLAIPNEWIFLLVEAFE
jgi:hypothetical protein